MHLLTEFIYNKLYKSQSRDGVLYSLMQSDQNSSKTDTFHGPTTYEPHV